MKGSFIGIIKGDTKRLDYGSYNLTLHAGLVGIGVSNSS